MWKDAPVGTPLMKVHAFDSDSEVNSKVEYRFVEGNDKFEISEEGVISTKESLQSFLGTWNFRITASNIESMTVGEENPIGRATKIRIYVTDLEPPKFTNRIFNGTITENSIPGEPVKC